MNKTLGQTISDLRTQRGLSQSELAEVLDVSRQSISKWETDTALPEIDKLIALSKYFGIPVGVLLGLDEEQTSETVPDGELSETQLKMVQEIVDRYLAAQPKPMSKKRKLILKAAIAVAVVCLVVGLVKMQRQLRRVDQQYYSLQNAINEVNSSVNGQIGGISARVEELLKQQNDLTADYKTEVKSMDLKAGTVTFSFRALPKTYTEGMQAWLEIVSGTEKQTFGPYTTDGQTFSGEVTTVLSDDISLYIVFETDKREAQLLDAYTDLETDTRPTVYFDEPFLATHYQSYPKQPPQNALHLSDNQFQLTIESNMSYSVSGYAELAKVTSCRVGLFKNQKLAFWLEQEAYQSTDMTGPYWGTTYLCYDLPADTELRAKVGDEVCLAAVLEDEFGRTFIHVGEMYAVIRADGGALSMENTESNYDPFGNNCTISDPDEITKWSY